MSWAMRAAGDTVFHSGRGKGRVCIVNYHRILEQADPLLDSEPDIERFRWQMTLLANCFNVIPLHDAVQGLRTGSIPPRAVCITFDDGYASTHDVALPILKALNLPATVFVTSGYMDGSNMWNDRIIEAVRRLSGKQLDLRASALSIYPIETIADRKHTIRQLTEDLKYLLPQERLDLTQHLEHLAGQSCQRGLMLTRSMICHLAQEGIEIGAHTISHPILTCLDDKAARDEIEGGKQQLEALIGKPVRLFAYPNGKVGRDFDSRHVEMAKEAGFTAAFTTAIGAAGKGHDQYQIPRSCPWDVTPFLFGIRLLRWLAH